MAENAVAENVVAENVVAENTIAAKGTKRTRIVLPRTRPDESYLKILLTGLFPGR